ncbi:MAG TPA: hypothetical protein VFX58_01420 [Chitinophagaceae bacterium]|nr:hypothetical protein [Chitinophagaceae bacterium]
MKEGTVFKAFYSIEEALALQELLKNNGLWSRVEQKRVVVDKVIAGTSAEPEHLLLLSPSDFSAAHAIIDNHILANLHEVDPDYYLFSFSNEELQEIIARPDEWNNQDFLLAKYVLRERGVHLSEDDVNQARKNRYYELARPEQESSTWIIAGYFTAVFFCIIGLIFGLTFMNARKLLPDGSRVMAYNEKTRSHGRKITFIAVIMLILLITGIFTRQIRYGGGFNFF